ncbi:MAG: sigma-54-dependent Fis family transcriptional regulator [Deltaproteobacteria bacterium]|nr:sigma-54-dependent Fis family transcriptional regulator [Deltaproteobacteria bacterium]
MNLDKTILIIDDEENIRRYLGHSLKKDGFEVETAKFGKEGINLLLQKHIDVVLLDLNLPDMNGLEVLEEIKNLDVQSVVIIITAYGDISSAVEAIKLGAYDYLTKPFEIEDVMIVINKALRIIGLENRIRLLEKQVDRYQDGELITRSRKMFELLDFVEQIANTSSTVMIHGETGTGKELIASLIHKKSNRTKRPFVTIDCTSLPENLLESELFGHVRGAFTGAIGLKKGLFEVADEGTVFLDEIGELPFILQAKILRVLENKSFRRVGGEKYIETDVRIIAATNRDLKTLVDEEHFRSDLFYRLNVVPIHIPPLRNRREDIFPLIEYFVHHFNKKIGRNILDVTNETLKLMIEYDWPGNIRELRNVIEHMMITTKDDVISVENLPGEIRLNKNKMDFQPGLLKKDSNSLPDFRRAKKRIIEDFEKSYLTTILIRNEWNISQCAREIDMHRSSFQRLIKKYGLKR